MRPAAIPAMSTRVFTQKPRGNQDPASGMRNSPVSKDRSPMTASPPADGSPRRRRVNLRSRLTFSATSSRERRSNFCSIVRVLNAFRLPSLDPSFGGM